MLKYDNHSRCSSEPMRPFDERKILHFGDE